MGLHNLARMTTATSGTGTITLGSAVSGFLSFDDAGVANAEVVTYSIRDGANSEIGIGTYTTSGTTLSRDTVYNSTAAGAKISLSGSAEVFITAAAQNIIGWVKTVNENGTSFANWTSNVGTWSSDGTVIKQTDTDAAVKTAYYTAKVDTSNGVFQTDIQLKNSGVNCRAGVLIGWGVVNNGALVYLDEGNNKIYWENDGVQALMNVAATIAVDTWYTLKIVFHGGRVTAYLDGTLMGTAAMVGSYDVSYIGLYSYTAQVWWRNITMHNLTLP